MNIEIIKVKVIKRENSFCGHEFFEGIGYKELGFHKDSDFTKIKEGEFVDAIVVSEEIMVNSGRKKTSWQFYKVL